MQDHSSPILQVAGGGVVARGDGWAHALLGKRQKFNTHASAHMGKAFFQANQIKACFLGF
jgi:hypothetical protein